MEYFTPSAKDLHRDLLAREEKRNKDERKSTDKKRKRGHVEDLDLTAARLPSQESEDLAMSDAPAPSLHTGLTGGLNRLLSSSKFPPSPDYSNCDPDPPSPVGRSRPSSTTQTLIARERSRSKPTTSSALVKVRKRRTSDESRPRKKHHRSSHRHHEDSHDKPKRKAIEYPAHSTEDSQQQVVIFKSRAELFMSFVTKGEGSERGMSVHKALKRYHRERGRVGKEDEEKELWKGLRLRKNERGEIVVFF